MASDNDNPLPTEKQLATWDADRRDKYEAGRGIDNNPTRTTWTIDGRELTQLEFSHHNLYVFFADRYREGADRFISALLHLLKTMEIRTDAKQGKRAKPHNQHSTG